MMGFNAPLSLQIARISEAVRWNESLYAMMETARDMNLPPYYFGAGSIVQTVWNYQLGNAPMYGISDIDFVYHDASDISYEAEDEMICRVGQMLSSDIPLDIKNQARVHLWYATRFGKEMAPYVSLEDAINHWPTTASAIGMRLERQGLSIYAPYGLNDLLGMVVRANKTQITQDVFEAKAAKWKTKWPSVSVVPW